MPASIGDGGKRAIASLGLTGRETLIDVCTGTADVALEATGAARIVGVDFAGAMLALGLRKVRAAGARDGIALVRGDAMRIPARDRMRRCGHRRVRHSQRAAARGGLCRDGSRAAPGWPPRDPRVRRAADSRRERALPAGTSGRCCRSSGRLISGHTGAYSYLPASVGTFPPPAEFMTLLRQAGFAEVRAVPLTFGIVYLYTAVKASTGG